MNSLYDTARRRMIASNFNWAALPVKLLAFVEPPAGPYVFDPVDNTIADLGVTAVAESLLFTNKAVSTQGYASSDQAWFQSVPLSEDWAFFVMVDNTLAGSARQLIAYYDTAINLPREINGQDEIVIPDWSSERGWFRA